MTRKLIIITALSLLLMAAAFVAVAYLYGFLLAICVYVAAGSLTACVVAIIKLSTMDPKE